MPFRSELDSIATIHRALELGMRIDIAIVDAAPLGVDAPDDLERARAAMADGKAS